MATDGFAVLRELEQWLAASVAEAERLLPNLFNIPASLLRSELKSRPELRTAGIIQRLNTTAHDALEAYPRRAHELTSIAVEFASAIAFPAAGTSMARRVEAQAWTEHARALRGIDEHDAARCAVEIARGRFAQLPASGWHLANIDLLEGQLLYDDGECDEALLLVRDAGTQFAMHGDPELFIEARMLETWMLNASGHRDAAAEVWRATADVAQQRGDPVLMARLGNRMGVLQLRNGSAEEACRHLSAALTIFEAERRTPQAIRARWSLAEASAARGRIHEAISEYHKVRAQLLATRAPLDAALASCEILALLFGAGREEEAARLAATLITDFRDAGMAQNGLDAFNYLRTRAESGELADEDVTALRRHFEELVHRQNAAFVPPVAHG